ncbi:hypothetical protein ACHAXA_008871 [Cyclostephanos tholiformis]|uniref:RNA helicase n=1 Tax=Cyclostephanos tholiformis TaxID=382380 RepID=A0ABD3SG26_9STRA
MHRPLSSSLCMQSSSSAAAAAALVTLPDLYPKFASILASGGYVAPTPIQRTSASSAGGGENLLLIAATGSGKTLAYLLPALSRAANDDDDDDEGGSGRGVRRGTVLIVAPTRELSAQLARDASLLLPDDGMKDDYDRDDDATTMLPNVLLAVRGMPPPTPSQLRHASVLVGTPNELHMVLTRISGAQNFLAGDKLSGVILDEVDVLLPSEPKGLRTTFDGNDDDRGERMRLERRRKMRAAQRRGVEFHVGSNMGGGGKSLDSVDLSNSMNSRVLAPTERLLRLIASNRRMGDVETVDRLRLQLLAGSATASRAALDRLNRALKAAAMEGGMIGVDGFDDIWGGRMKICRPEDGDDVEVLSSLEVSSPTTTEATHTIRAVTVPSVVDHRYVFMSKDTATNPHEILANVAKITRLKSPSRSLVFICGEFSRSLSKEKEKEASKASGKTTQARRNAKQALVEKQKKTENSNAPGGPEPLSVRKACSILQSMGVDAHPMHVVLGLESNVGNDGTMIEEEDEDSSNEVELPPMDVEVRPVGATGLEEIVL